MDRKLNENGKMVAVIAAIIIAGDRANPAINNSLSYYNTDGAINAAVDIARKVAMNDALVEK